MLLGIPLWLLNGLSRWCSLYLKRDTKRGFSRPLGDGESVNKINQDLVPGEQGRIFRAHNWDCIVTHFRAGLKDHSETRKTAVQSAVVETQLR